MDNETELWTERAGMMDVFISPFVFIYIAFLPFIFLARLNTRYTLTSERLIVAKGLLSRKIDEIELFRIKDVTLSQSFFQRLVGYGNVKVASSDTSGTFFLNHLPKANQRREEIRRQSMICREAKGVRTIVS
jgi:uncharacterized membrane protein YdbT with pleckstrin-like domain